MFCRFALLKTKQKLLAETILTTKDSLLPAASLSIYFCP